MNAPRSAAFVRSRNSRSKREGLNSRGTRALNRRRRARACEPARNASPIGGGALLLGRLAVARLWGWMSIRWQLTLVPWPVGFPYRFPAKYRYVTLPPGASACRQREFEFFMGRETYRGRVTNVDAVKRQGRAIVAFRFALLVCPETSRAYGKSAVSRK